MSERSFFNMRNLLPGVTFVLGVITTISYYIYENYTTLNISINNINIILSSIISLPAIGILTSQIWHVSLNQLIRRGYQGRSITTIKNKLYKSKKNGNKYQISNKDYDHMLFRTIRDYILHYYMILNNKEPVNTRNYLSRRWDILNTLGSSYISYIIGLLFIITINHMIKESVINTTINPITIPHILIIPIVILYGAITYYSINTINYERQNISAALINTSNITKDELEIAFPQLIFKIK